MDAKQRSFLVEAKRYALRKADSEEPQDLCGVDIKINRLSSILNIPVRRSRSSGEM